MGSVLLDNPVVFDPRRLCAQMKFLELKGKKNVFTQK